MVDFGNERFDVILLAGQSNAEGNGAGPVSEEYLPDDDILKMTGYRCYRPDSGWELPLPVEFQIEPADSRVADDLSLAFAHEYKKQGLLQEGRKILIVHAALGGTGFYAGHWGMRDRGYLRMKYLLSCALNLNPDNRLVALLWHQGESDAVYFNPPATFHDQLTACFESIKKIGANDTLPILTADFVADWKSKNQAACDPIVAQIQKVTLEQGGRFIETQDLLSNDQAGTGEGDDIHFCRQALHVLGKRYFQAFLQIQNQQK